MDIGEKIKYYRKQCGLTQKELGERLGVSASMIGQYENSTRNPKMETIQKIADVLGVNISSLVELPGHEEPYYLDDDTREMVEFLHNNPDYKVLFDASRNVKKEDIDFVKQMMDRLRGDNHGDDTGC